MFWSHKTRSSVEFGPFRFLLELCAITCFPVPLRTEEDYLFMDVVAVFRIAVKVFSKVDEVGTLPHSRAGRISDRMFCGSNLGQHTCCSER
jgi:hypothetical protein